MSGDGDLWDPVDMERDLGLDRPGLARVCDHLLGGARSLALDREAAARLLAVVPEAAEVARATRYFATWAIREAVARGVRQFLDLGSGLPLTCCHSALRAADPRAVAVLVDRDVVVATHLERHLDGVPGRLVVRGDLRGVGRVLVGALEAGVIDPLAPVGILATGVLHLVPGAVEAVMAAYREAVAPGSVLAITHPGPLDDPDRDRALGELHDRAGAGWCPRGWDAVAGLFGDWEPIDATAPGVLGSLAGWTHHPADGRRAADPGLTAPFLEAHSAGLAVKPPVRRADTRPRVPRPRDPRPAPPRPSGHPVVTAPSGG